MTNKEHTKYFWFCIYILIFIAGMFAGMLLQQRIIKQSMIEIGYSFAGTINELDVDVDINETLIVDRTMDRMIPFLNQTIKEEIENDI